MPKLLAPIINIVISIVEGILSLRIILKLFGASTTAPFVSWIYETSEPLLTPFIGMFPSPKLTGGFVIEFSALFALTFYAFIGYLAVEVLDTLIYYTHKRQDKHSR